MMLKMWNVNKCNMKEKYTPPTFTVVTFHVEQGFAGTAPDPVFNFELFLSESDENLNQAATYNEGYWNW